MTALTGYQAAKSRVERFRGGERLWAIYHDDQDAIRADLNLIAEREAGQVETALQVPAIDARTLMMAHVMGGMAAHYGVDPGFDPAVNALAITDAALAALKGGE